jgi:hypothetical protein
MVRRRLCSAALVLSLVLAMALAAIPAGAVQPRRARPATDAWSWLPQLWRAAIERVVSMARQGDLGPGMDPNGLSAAPGPAPQGGVPSGASDLGPDMDPNGAK